MAKVHIRNLLIDSHPEPVPEKVICIGKSRDTNEEHQIYMQNFENISKYDFLKSEDILS